VTRAILRAEALTPGSWEAERAFRDVADLEGEIAAIAGAHTVEGEVAPARYRSAIWTARTRSPALIEVVTAPSRLMTNPAATPTSRFDARSSP